MGLSFVPFSDLSSVASDASSITTLDFDYLQAGEETTQAIRIANTSNADTTFQLVTADSRFTITPATGNISANGLSDTITINLTLPLDCESESYAIGLFATDGNGNVSALTLTYTAVGVNEERRSESPERNSNFTESIGNIIATFAEPLRIYRYDPIAYNIHDTRIIIDPTQSRKLTTDAKSHRFISQNVESKLDPENATWGYVRTDSIILANFQGEHESVRIDFVAESSSMTYTNTAQLVIPAEYELQRLWAMFAPARDPDIEQHKRTVFLFKRQGELWAIHNVYARYRGNELSHYECDCIQLHCRAMGSPDFFNPFALTYAYESDKPYSCFALDICNFIAETIADSSGSGANPSCQGLSTLPHLILTYEDGAQQIINADYDASIGQGHKSASQSIFVQILVSQEEPFTSVETIGAMIFDLAELQNKSVTKLELQLYQITKAGTSDLTISQVLTDIKYECGVPTFGSVYATVNPANGCNTFDISTAIPDLDGVDRFTIGLRVTSEGTYLFASLLSSC